MYEKLFAQSGLSLERLKAFADIIAAGGITHASGNDSNRQSQLSRQLTELERFFGVKLLERGRGPMKLTAAGQRLKEIIHQSFGSMEEFHRDCSNQPLELSLGAGESLIQWLLLPRFASLKSAHPRLHLNLQNLRTDDILQGIVDGSLDFGITNRHHEHSKLITLPLGNFDYGLYLPAELKLPSNKPTSKVLKGLPMAILNGSPAVRQAMELEAQKHGFKLDIRLYLSSYPQLAQAFQHLQVAVVMPTLAAQALPKGSYQVIRPPFIEKLSRNIWLIWNKSAAAVRPSITTYAQVFAQAFKQG